MKSPAPHFPPRAWVVAIGLVAAIAARARAGVVINEVHYHPAEGSSFEFVEILNDSTGAVNVGRWAFRNGVHVEIPAGPVIPPGGFLVVCENPADLALRYALPPAALVPWVDSSLANEGEELVLVDANGAVVDAVRFDDQVPWPTGADGGGASLQRLCARADSNQPTNWAG